MTTHTSSLITTAGAMTGESSQGAQDSSEGQSEVTAAVGTIAGAELFIDNLEQSGHVALGW